MDLGRPLQDKLKECVVLLKTWGNKITGSFKIQIVRCKKIMKKTKDRRDTQSVKKFQEVSNRLNKIYNQQEVFWRQRSK